MEKVVWLWYVKLMRRICVLGARLLVVLERLRLMREIKDKLGYVLVIILIVTQIRQIQ